MGLLWRYKATPGAAADAPPSWPGESAIARTPGRPTLVMLAHPQCPCTRASLDELAVVMSRAHGQVAAWVLFVKPEGTERDFADSSTRHRAEEIDGVTVLVDEGGREAERFGAKVSGQTMLYDADGVLRFSGGITGARGHAGDNVGRQRLLASPGGGLPDAPTASVFGCGLLGPARAATP